MPAIHQLTTFSLEDFNLLKKERAILPFLLQIEQEWAKGWNQFNKRGEGLFVLKKQSEIIGIGGISQYPFSPPTAGIGYLQGVYIAEKERRNGYGALLLNHLLQFAKMEFFLVKLSPDNFPWAIFFEANGFEQMRHPFEVTYQIMF